MSPAKPALFIASVSCSVAGSCGVLVSCSALAFTPLACGSSDQHQKSRVDMGGAAGIEGGGAGLGGAGESAGGAGEAAKPGGAGEAGVGGGELSAGGNPSGGTQSQAGDGADAGAGGAIGPNPPNPFVASRAAEWSVRFGGTGAQQTTAIAAPLTGGGVVVVGQMEGTLVTSKTTLTSAGSLDAFAIKLDEAGAVVWALSFGDAGDQRATAVAIDASGNVFIGGFTQPASSINFGSGTQTGGTFFIVEVDAAGAYVRGGVIPSAGNTRLKGLAIGPSDSLLYAADLPPGATLTAGCTTPNQNQYINNGTTNSGVVVDLSSTLQCVRDMGVGADAMLGVVYTLKNQLVLPERLAASGQTPSSIAISDHAYTNWSMSSLIESIAVQGAGAQLYELSAAGDGAGGLLMGGSYFGSAALVNSTVLPAKADGSAAFVAKADDLGTVSWTRSYGAQASGRVASVSAMSNAGHSYIAGSAQGILDFGAGPVLPIGKDAPFDNTYFVASLGGNGNAVWATRFALGATSPTIAIASVLDDHVYVTGALDGTTDLGKGALTSAGGDDVFVARFAP